MKMDDLDRAKCQKSKRRDTQGILEIVNEEKDKNLHSVVFLKLKPKTGRMLEVDAIAVFFFFFF